MPQTIPQNKPEQKNLCEAVGKAGTLSKKTEKDGKRENRPLMICTNSIQIIYDKIEKKFQ